MLVFHNYYSNSFNQIIIFFFILANTGGLLGLFMGFSFVSLIELFYFMSLRPYSNYIRISHNRERAFGHVFNKFRNFRFTRKDAKKPQKQIEKMERNVVFPYVN